MKNAFASLVIALALALSARAADVSTKISDVHLCCQSCVKGVKKAVADIKNVKADVDQDAETVTLTGSDQAAVQKAVPGDLNRLAFDGTGLGEAVDFDAQAAVSRVSAATG